MSLSSLKFINEVRPTPAYRATPLEKVRQTLLAGIATQRQLIAEAKGEAVSLTKVVAVAAEDGTIEKKTVVRHPVRWFWRGAKGYRVELLYARIPVPVGGPNKTTIDCGLELDDVVKALDLLEQAIIDGSLDKVLTDIGAQARKSKKAA